MQHLRPPVIVALCVLLGACGTGQPGGSPPGESARDAKAALPGAGAVPPMAQSDTGEFHHDDPCSLLTATEVEAAMRTRLGTPPYRGSSTDPEADGSDCVYMTRNFQTVTLNVVFDGGQQAYHVGDLAGNLIKGAKGVVADQAKRIMVSEDGSEIAGEWDEAKLTPMNCCIFNALRGDQMITIDFTGSTMTLKQAAGLVDAAFKRIDKPLTLDGGANVAVADAFLKTRPRPKHACSVLAQSEVETIIGKLDAAPREDADTCTYELPRLPGRLPRIYELAFAWRGGNYRLRSDLAASRMAGAALGGITFRESTQVQVPNTPASGASTRSSGTHTETITRDVSVDEASRKLTGHDFSGGMHLAGERDASADGPWEQAATVGPKFEAVRTDVLVSVGMVGVDVARARALVAAAMKKL